MLPIEDQLRRYVDALADSLAPTLVGDLTIPMPDPIVHDFPSPPGPGRTHRWLIAAAAVLLVAAAAVGAVRWIEGDTGEVDVVDSVGTTPAIRADGVITDPLQIDLDPWLEGAPSNWSLVNGPYLIFDTTKVPDGWEVISVSGSEAAFGSVDSSGEPLYQFAAEFSGPDGNFFRLNARPSGPEIGQLPPEFEPVVIRGQDGFMSDRILRWVQQGRLEVTLLADTSSSESRDLMVELAESLDIVSVDVLPLLELPVHFFANDLATPQPPVLAGTNRGHSWQFGVTNLGYGGEIAIDGRAISSFVLARPPEVVPSNPTTANPPVDIRGGMSGVTGGVVIVGIVSDTAPIDHLVVETSNGVQIKVPVVHLADLGAIAFAVPVAADLDLTRIHFLDATGTQRYELSVPRSARSEASTAFGGSFLIEGTVTELTR